MSNTDMPTAIENEMHRLNATPMKNGLTATEELIELAEKSLGVQFPQDYRQFLLQFSHYSVVADCSCATLDGTYVDYFHGFRSDWEESESFLELDELGLVPHAISIACDAFGGQFLMLLTPNNNGRIYFCDVEGGGGDILDDPDWDPEEHSLDDLPKYDNRADKPDLFQNLHFVSTGLTDFLGNLKPKSGDGLT